MNPRTIKNGEKRQHTNEGLSTLTDGRKLIVARSTEPDNVGAFDQTKCVDTNGSTWVWKKNTKRKEQPVVQK